jgi:hypothetical protein
MVAMDKKRFHITDLKKVSVGVIDSNQTPGRSRRDPNFGVVQKSTGFINDLLN